MTLKTDNKKVAYWIITITIIVITFVLISANTSMRKVMLARSADGKVYVIDTNWSCGKCDVDYWIRGAEEMYKFLQSETAREECWL